MPSAWVCSTTRLVIASQTYHALKFFLYTFVWLECSGDFSKLNFLRNGFTNFVSSLATFPDNVNTKKN